RGGRNAVVPAACVLPNLARPYLPRPLSAVVGASATAAPPAEERPVMKRLPLAFLIALSATTALSAQPTPFDMTPERSKVAPDSSLPPEDLGIEPPAPQPGDAQSAEFRRPLLPTGDIMLQGEIASRSWALHLTNAQASAPMRLHLGYSNAIVVAPAVPRLQILINDSVCTETTTCSADVVGAC